MFFRRKKKEIEIKACFKGKLVKIEDVNDPMFSEKLMGDGVAIEPDEGDLYAPITGTVSAIFDTKHAIGFTLENGAEILIHIGIDTVELEGKGFNLNISKGDKVMAGDKIGEIDLEYIRSQGKEVTTPVLLTNMETYEIHSLKNRRECNKRKYFIYNYLKIKFIFIKRWHYTKVL